MPASLAPSVERCEKLGRAGDVATVPTSVDVL